MWQKNLSSLSNRSSCNWNIRADCRQVMLLSLQQHTMTAVEKRKEFFRAVGFLTSEAPTQQSDTARTSQPDHSKTQICAMCSSRGNSIHTCRYKREHSHCRMLPLLSSHPFRGASGSQRELTFTAPANARNKFHSVRKSDFHMEWCLCASHSQPAQTEDRYDGCLAQSFRSISP